MMAETFHSSLSIEAPLVRNTNRLEAYSDALFSIIATIMVLPIAHTELPDDEALSSSMLRLVVPKLVVYIYTFCLICAEWTKHVRIFDIIVKVDEFSVLVNLGLMMTITFLPLTFTILAEFVEYRIAIQIFASSCIVLVCCRFLLLYHGFSNPLMLNQELIQAGELDKEQKKLYLSIIVSSVGCVLAIISAVFSGALALAFLAFIPFGDYIINLFRRCCKREIDHLNLPAPVPLARRLFTETVSKERIEFFSDGVFAIVATLIILDICDESVPTKEEVNKIGSLAKALSQDSHIYLAYGGTFITVGLQWYVHHSLFYYVKEVNKLMMIFNFMCLMFIGLSPMAFKLTSTFDGKHDGDNVGNEMFAIQVNSAVILCSGLCQCVVWIAGLYDEGRLLMPGGHHSGRDHKYVTTKVFIYPFISLCTFFFSFIPNFKVTVFIAVQISAVAIFVLLGLLFIRLRKWTDNQASLNVLSVQEEDEDTSTIEQELNIAHPT